MTENIDDFQFITADELARRLDVTRATVYRQTELGILPPPVYVTPRAARWNLSEVLQALEARRAVPREALARGRGARRAPLAAGAPRHRVTPPTNGTARR